MAVGFEQPCALAVGAEQADAVCADAVLHFGGRVAVAVAEAAGGDGEVGGDGVEECARRRAAAAVVPQHQGLAVQALAVAFQQFAFSFDVEVAGYDKRRTARHDAQDAASGVVVCGFAPDGEEFEMHAVPLPLPSGAAVLHLNRA